MPNPPPTSNEPPLLNPVDAVESGITDTTSESESPIVWARAVGDRELEEITPPENFTGIVFAPFTFQGEQMLFYLNGVEAGSWADIAGFLFLTVEGTVVFADTGGTPSIAGYMQRNGNDLYYSDGTTTWQLSNPTAAQTADHTHASAAEAGASLAPTSLDVAGAISLSNQISPASFGVNQDNFDPTGLATASVIRLTTSVAGTNITGIQRAAADSRLILLINVGTNAIDLTHEDGASTARMRFLCEGASPATLDAGESKWILGDPTSNRWRVLGGL